MVAIKKTIHAHIVSTDQKNPTQIGKVFSLLPSDYRGLINLPTINGTEVIGDMKAKELSLLSSRVDDYNEHELGADEDEGKYFVLVGADEEVAKVPAKTVANALSLIKTTDEIDENMEVGAYRFVEKKRGE